MIRVDVFSYSSCSCCDSSSRWPMTMSTWWMTIRNSLFVLPCFVRHLFSSSQFLSVAIGFSSHVCLHISKSACKVDRQLHNSAMNFESFLLTQCQRMPQPLHVPFSRSSFVFIYFSVIRAREIFWQQMTRMIRVAVATHTHTTLTFGRCTIFNYWTECRVDWCRVINCDAFCALSWLLRQRRLMCHSWIGNK